MIKNTTYAIMSRIFQSPIDTIATDTTCSFTFRSNENAKKRLFLLYIDDHNFNITFIVHIIEILLHILFH